MKAEVKNTEISDKFYNSSMDLIKENYLSGAACMLKEALELDGDNPQYLDALGLCMFARGDFEQAKVFWMRSIELDSVPARTEQYLKSMDSEDFIKYIQAFNFSIEAVDEGKYVKALLRIIPLLKLTPNVEGYNLAGLLFYKLGMRKSASRLWKEALDIDLSDKKAAYYIINCREGFLPYAFEKILWEVLAVVGRLKLL